MCEQVLWLIKNSGLNFQVRETPFSLDINLKKCYAKLWNQNNGNPVSSQPAHYLFSSQNHPAQETQDNLKDNSELLYQIDLLKVKLEKALHEKDDASQDLLKLDQAHRKLAKENKELLKKHEQICSERKVVKGEKENITRENSTLSVALKASKKSLKTDSEMFDKERKVLHIELEKLNKFKIEKDAEQKEIKKAEKKNRQRDKKLAKENSMSTDVNSISKDVNSNDTPEHNSDGLMKTKSRLSAQHMSDAFNNEVSKQSEVEASESVISVNNPSGFMSSSDTSPLTVNDLEDLLTRFKERFKT